MSRPKLPWDIARELPDLMTDTPAWVAKTDAIVKRRFDPKLPLEFDFHRSMSASTFNENNTPESLQEIDTFRRHSCTFHHDISNKITIAFTQKGLRGEWLALNRLTQQEHLYEAFRAEHTHFGSRTPFSATGPTKLECPELLMDELLRDGGLGILDLADKFLLEDNDRKPTTPFVLVHKRYDEWIGYKTKDKTKMRKVWLELRRGIRTVHIGQVLISWILGHFKIEPANRPVILTHDHHKTRAVMEKSMDVIRAMNADDSPKAAKNLIKETVAARKDWKLFCETCHKTEDKVKDGKMRACSKCSTVDRQVRYCSRECQVKAWPVHKKTCGRPYEAQDLLGDVDHIVTEGAAKDNRLQIPPASSGFKRSADLLEQISNLNYWLIKDYFCPDELKVDDAEVITLDELPAVVVFMYMRNLAMSTGHEGALLYVYRVLQRHAFADGPTQPEGILERQLTREYGVRFERVLAAEARNALPKVPEVPVSEAKRSIKVLKDIGRFKEELESYEPEDDDGKKIQKLYMQVGPKKDVASTVYFPRDALPPMIDMWPANIPPSAQTPKNRSERRAIAAAAAKKKPDGTVPEPAGKGPNFETLPWTPEEPHPRPAALEKQMEYLRANPKADYILWGQSDDLTTAYAISFWDFRIGPAVLGARRRLFIKGGANQPALSYFIMTLVPAVRRRKISLDAIVKQLTAEYDIPAAHIPAYARGPDVVPLNYLQMCVDQIDWRRMTWTSRDTGKVYAIGDIPASMEHVSAVMPLLMEVGRYEDVFAETTMERLQQVARNNVGK